MIHSDEKEEENKIIQWKKKENIASLWPIIIGLFRTEVVAAIMAIIIGNLIDQHLSA